MACNCVGPWGNCPCVRGRGYYGAWWGVVPPPGWYYDPFWYGPARHQTPEEIKAEWEKVKHLFDVSKPPAQKDDVV